MELSVSIAVLGLLLIAFALSLDGFRRFNDYQLVRQQCVSGAQAEIESIAVTGREIEQEDFKRLWPKLNVSIEKSEGAGQWQGMTLIAVTAKSKSFNKDVTVKLSRYIEEDNKWKTSEHSH